jgi:hypothetical protein
MDLPSGIPPTGAGRETAVAIVGSLRHGNEWKRVGSLGRFHRIR